MAKPNVEYIINRLRAESSRHVLNGLEGFGITEKNRIGVSVPNIRKIARQIGKNHEMAIALWDSEIDEARILASMIDDPRLVTEKQAEKWVKGIGSWDICDSFCGNLLDKTEFAYKKAIEWSGRKEEFVKRAAFATMAYIAVHDKGISNSELVKFFPIMERECTDERNFVKKAVNWSLRQVGKRNIVLNRKAIITCNRIRDKDSGSARWIAGDALRELESKAVKDRLNGRN